MTALDFGPGGVLYLVSADAGEVYRTTPAGLSVIASGWNRPAGIEVLRDGRVCVSRSSDDPPISRKTLVSCYDGADWQTFARGVGSGINGIAEGPDGLWLAAWRATPIESRDGSVVVMAEGSVVREVALPGVVPQFLAVRPDGTAWVSAWSEDATGFTGGSIFVIHPGGRVDRLQTDLDRPSGLAYEEGHGLWLADFSTGSIYLIPEASLDQASSHLSVSDTVAKFRTHEGVLGLAHSNDRLCAAHPEGWECFDAHETIQTRGT